MKKICLIVPSLSSGGMERVMSEIANYFSQKMDVEVHIILLLNKKKHFTLNKTVKLHEPIDKKRFIFFRILIFLRKTIMKIKPDTIISFGSMYNSFVMLSCFGLENKIKIYLSDRSNPYRNTYFTMKKGGDERHDGFLHFILKRFFYRRAYGILCQTKLSMQLEHKSLKHRNIIYFPNPISLKQNSDNSRENIILNVGRFIGSKQQELLVDIFQRINNKKWKLLFLGDGETLESVKERVLDDFKENIIFGGNVENVASYMRKSKIFAFTSRSEGFPNALAEALATPLASISFDCIAGPSDLIVDNYNGFLVSNNNSNDYLSRLKILMENEELRELFEKNSLSEMKKFEKEKILEDLLKII